MATRSHMPMTAAAINPAIPITETLKKMGGTLELISIAEPKIKAAIMIAKETLLLV